MDLNLSYLQGKTALLTVGADAQWVDYETESRSPSGVVTPGNKAQANSIGYFAQEKIQWQNWVFRAGAFWEIRPAMWQKAMAVAETLGMVEKTGLFGTAVHAVLRQGGDEANSGLREAMTANGVVIDGLELVVPSSGLKVPVERVWTRRPGKAQPIACGLALRRDSAVDARWRSFVDGLDLLPGILPTPGGSGLPA